MSAEPPPLGDARAAWTLEKTARHADGQTGTAVWWVEHADGRLWTPLEDRDAELVRSSRSSLLSQIETLLAASGALGV